ncbi:MAG: hypothetical protein DPW16_01885 [Chloroflexi bacterium]|nr:hypothetical protein [Chloroflexota bacterium]
MNWILPEIPPQLQRRRLALMGLFVALALIYMLTSPIFEVSDEMLHFPVVDYIASTGKLPYQDPTKETLWRQEGSQPPLYYLIAALLVLPIDRSDLETRLFYNPHSKVGIGLASDNQNIIVHDAEAESFPYKQTTLAVMICRLFSILLGAGTVWLTFDMARLAIPTRPMLGFLAMAFVAFNPMFLFITASVNNDNLVIFLGTAIIVQMLALWRLGWHWGRIGLLSVLLGMAALTKLSGLTFAPMVALTIFAVYWREHRPFKDLVVAGIAVAAGIGLIAGWWYIRNVQLYDDPTGLNTMIEIAGKRPANFGLQDVWAEREGFYYAYWGWFGGLNVISPQRFFDYTLAIGNWGAAGLVLIGVRCWKRCTSASPVVLLLVQLALIFGGVVRWTLQTPASQGRLLFPAIAIIGVLLAIGWSGLLRMLGLPNRLAAIAVMPLATYALILPFTVIRPAYTPPDTIEQLPSDVRLTDAQFGPIQLLGYQIDDTPVILNEKTDDEIEITLYWRPQAQSETPLSFYIQVFGPAANLTDPPVVIGKLDSFPGRGLRRTDTWEIGKIYAETYHIEINDDLANTPFEPRFKIGWRDFFAGVEIASIRSDATAISEVILRGGSIVGEYDGDGYPCCDVSFGNVAWLRADLLRPSTRYQVQPNDTIELSWTWYIANPTSADFTVFVQLIDPANPAQLWGSGDAVPRQDWYPTHAWLAKKYAHDKYMVRVSDTTPPGVYRILIGFYRPSDGVRLPVNAPSWDGVPNPFPDAFLSPIEVEVLPAESPMQGDE